MPRSHLLTEQHLPELRKALESQTLTALAASYGVSLSTMGPFLRKHGVLPEYDGWRPERYDRLLVAAARQASVAETAALLGTNTAEVQARLKQLLNLIKEQGFMLSQLATVTSVDRAYWRQYIAEGWLGTAKGARATRVPVPELVSAALTRPELFDYGAIAQQIAEPLGLRSLPAAARFKLVTCRSGSIEARVVDLPADETGPRVQYEVASCGALGGVDLWAAMYVIPTCPRCGLRVSRFSEKRIYADMPGDSASVKDAMASKIGLRWREGHFETLAGERLGPEAVEQYVSRLAQRNSRDRERKLKLIDDIVQYKVAIGPLIL